MVSLEFFIDIILPAALWPWCRPSLWHKWVPGIFSEGKDDRRVGLTTLPTSFTDCLEIWETLNPWNAQGLSRPVMGLLYTYLYFLIVYSRSMQSIMLDFGFSTVYLASERTSQKTELVWIIYIYLFDINTYHTENTQVYRTMTSRYHVYTCVFT